MGAVGTGTILLGFHKIGDQHGHGSNTVEIVVSGRQRRS